MQVYDVMQETVKWVIASVYMSIYLSRLTYSCRLYFFLALLFFIWNAVDL